MTSIHCQSNCKNYDTNNIISISTSDYPECCQTLEFQPIMTVTIQKQTDSNLIITIGPNLEPDPSKTISVIVAPINTTWSVVNNNNNDVTVDITGMIISVILGQNTAINTNFYKPGDSYNLTPCLGFFVIAHRPLFTDISMNSNGSLNSLITSPQNQPNISVCNQGSCGNTGTTGCTGGMFGGCQSLQLSNIGEVRVPAILITAQTTVNGSDIGNVIFQICDQFTYYTPVVPELENYCTIRYIQSCQLRQTTFDLCCPFIVSVLKGIGETAYDKLIYIYGKMQNIIIIPFYQFQENIITYALIKLILARVLYGKFNIKYLLQKYNDKLLRDLRKSRFCAFNQFFTDPNQPSYGYNIYFKK